MLLTLIAVGIAGVVVGWTTPEPSWAKTIRVYLFGAVSAKFKEIEDAAAAKNKAS